MSETAEPVGGVYVTRYSGGVLDRKLIEISVPGPGVVLRAPELQALLRELVDAAAWLERG